MPSGGEGDVRRLPAAGVAWRSVALAVGLLLAAHGTILGNDDQWPFAPMSQFAFYVGRDSEIRAARVDALTTDGTIVQVPLTPSGVGFGRAEIEGQLPRLVKDPSLLQDIAVAFRRRHPDQPQYRRLWLREQVTTLRDGRATGRRVEDLAVWDVPDAH